MRRGRVTLPAEYAEWAGQEDDVFLGESVSDGSPAALLPGEAGGVSARASMPMMIANAPSADSGVADRRFRIVAPLNGDVYRIPPGVPGSYATIPFVAGGTSGAVRWFVDGVPFSGTRWQLVRGTHLIRAESAAGTNEVRIRVE
jgi:hypothetical protein